MESVETISGTIAIEIISDRVEELRLARKIVTKNVAKLLKKLEQTFDLSNSGMEVKDEEKIIDFILETTGIKSK